ncbi:MAG: hypothetical protein HN341_05540 [Verrucomicrobia bacterium]|nr:hypothetical protein [Verrucomicrobiota bacterium]
MDDWPEIFTHFTEPDNPDTDGDGLTDGEEINTYNTLPDNSDSDGDGTSDFDEVEVGTDPNDPLSFPSSISGELIYTNVQSGTFYAIATDGSNSWTNAIVGVGPYTGSYAITNLPSATNYVVSAYLDDTAQNMEMDLWEARGVYTNGSIWLTNAVTNINVWMVHPTNDTDVDGLTDYEEHYNYGTVVTNRDTDGDSMWDGWEVRYSLAVNPMNPADGGDDYFGELGGPDGLVNSNEFLWGTDPENGDTDGDSMPDGWEVFYSNAVNPLVMDGTNDYPGEFPAPDGLSNSNEYIWGTNPEVADSDGDGVSDGDEVSAGSDPTNAASYLVSISGSITYTGAYPATVHAVLTPSSGNVVSNEVTLTGTSGPYAFTNLDTLLSYDVRGFIDSNTNGTYDSWEALGSYVSNSIVSPTSNVVGVDVELQDPVMLDSDSDGLTDMDEHYVHLSNPDNADTDGDFMPDGWEFANSVAVNLLVHDGTNDFDADGLVNSNEFNASSDPNDQDSDGDSMWDGWEWDNRPAVNPTNPVDWQIDFEPDGLINSNEYVWGTDPNDADTDNDSMPDGWEVTYAAAVHPTNGLDGAIDYTNEWNAATGSVELDGLVNSNEFVYGTSPLLYDTDGDGPSDGQEVESGSDPTNAASYLVNISGFLWNATASAVSAETFIVLSLTSNRTDSTQYGIGVVTGSPPSHPFAVTNVPNRSNYWVSVYMDVNTNAIHDAWEPHGAPVGGATPAMNTNSSAGGFAIEDSDADSDGDGLSDYDEVHIFFTETNNVDTDADSFSDSNEVRRAVGYRTDPNDENSFPASIGGVIGYSGTQGGVVWVTASNDSISSVSGPYGIGSYATPTNLPTLTNYYVSAYRDQNGNGVMDLWEPRGDADTYPIHLFDDVTDANITLIDPSTDTDGDGLTDYEEYYNYGTSPTTNDTDGDSMLDGWEVFYTNACEATTNVVDAGEDYDLDGLTNLEEHNLDPQTDPENADSDGDGLTDGEEVNTYFTEPTIADTDGDGMPDGWEVTYISMLDPLVADDYQDPDGDNLWNLQEYEDSMTNPTTNDTDGEGLFDGDEYLIYSTIPTNTDTDADGFDDYEEVIEIGSMATNRFDPYVVDDNYPGDPGFGNPDISNPSENGRLPTLAEPLNAPYDAIQKAVDDATDGFTVLVLDGTYTGYKNRDVNPGGKAITIRSRNGYNNSTILDSAGGGFTCANGETTNTVIQGFTVNTVVLELGDPGVTCSNSSPTIKECRFYDCGEAGVLCQAGASPLIQDCRFEANDGGLEILDSSPLIERCTVIQNTAGDGAGLYIAGISQPHVVNCVIVQNVATNMGGGFYVGPGAWPTVNNCTVADNDASVAGGGFFNNGSLLFWNSILWDNTAPVGPGYHVLESFASGYDCLQTPHSGGNNNFVGDPQFVGVANYQLKSSSPCIDAGIDVRTDERGDFFAPADDHDGVQRDYAGGGHSRYDIGAYEYVPGGRIFVQAPGGTAGETLTASLATTVEWTWESDVGTNVNLYYTFDFLSQSPTWQTIATNVYRGTNGTGSHAWQVPQTNTSRCYVRVVDSTNSQVESISPYEFAIADGMELYEPNGGQTYYLGQTVDVSWASSVTTNPTVDLILSVDGSTFNIASGAVSVVTGEVHTAGGVTNQYSWGLALDAPDLLTLDGVLRVRSADGVLLDDSDSSFEVLGIVVTQPGETTNSVVTTGTVVNVNWTAMGAGGSVDISVSTNAGGTFSALTNGIACVDGTNTYPWMVGNTPTSNAFVMVESVSDTNIVGMSGEFRISDGITVFADIDGDGMTDEYEIASGLDYQSGAGDGGADGDPDGDGFVNHSEMVAGTDPMDPGSWIGVLTMTLEPAAGAGLDSTDVSPSFLFSTVDGRDYRVEAAPSPTGLWSDVSGPLTADGAAIEWVDSSGTPPPRFYRIIILSE